MRFTPLALFSMAAFSGHAAAQNATHTTSHLTSPVSTSQALTSLDSTLFSSQAPSVLTVTAPAPSSHSSTTPFTPTLITATDKATQISTQFPSQLTSTTTKHKVTAGGKVYDLTDWVTFHTTSTDGTKTTVTPMDTIIYDLAVTRPGKVIVETGANGIAAKSDTPQVTTERRTAFVRTDEGIPVVTKSGQAAGAKPFGFLARSSSPKRTTQAANTPTSSFEPTLTAQPASREMLAQTTSNSVSSSLRKSSN